MTVRVAAERRFLRLPPSGSAGTREITLMKSRYHRIDLACWRSKQPEEWQEDARRQSRTEFTRERRRESRLLQMTNVWSVWTVRPRSPCFRSAYSFARQVATPARFIRRGDLQNLRCSFFQICQISDGTAYLGRVVENWMT